MGSTLLCALFLIGAIIGIILLRDNVIWISGLIGGAVVLVVFLIYGIYQLSVAPPKNSIELRGGKLYVHPRKGEEHILELSDITRVGDKIHEWVLRIHSITARLLSNKK